MEVDELGPAVRDEAGRRLTEVERTDGVTIISAVESGSRAWGFPSPDSDFDVRFIYVRPTRDYLRLDPPRDVIERPLEGLWDVNGWDLRKALLLLRKGNAVVVEWLRSPLVYREVGPTAGEMRSLAERFFNSDDAVRHYFGLLRGQYQREFSGRDAVRLKKYFYAIRSASALAWLRIHGNVLPMALPELLAGDVAPSAVVDEVALLQAAKAVTNELGAGPRRPMLDAFIEDQMAWAQQSGFLRPHRADAGFFAATDRLFAEAIRSAEHLTS